MSFATSMIFLWDANSRMAQVILDTQKILLHISEQDKPSVKEVQKLLESSIDAKRNVAGEIVDLAADLLGPDKTLFVHSYSTHLAKTLELLAEQEEKTKNSCS